MDINNKDTYEVNVSSNGNHLQFRGFFTNPNHLYYPHIIFKLMNTNILTVTNVSVNLDANNSHTIEHYYPVSVGDDGIIVFDIPIRVIRFHFTISAVSSLADYHVYAKLIFSHSDDINESNPEPLFFMRIEYLFIFLCLIIGFMIGLYISNTDQFTYNVELYPKI